MPARPSRDTEAPRYGDPASSSPGRTSEIGTGSRDGAARPGGHGCLLHDRRGHQRHPVHDPASRARHRSERAARLHLRGPAGRAGGPGVRGAGLGDAARRRQLRVREPRAQSLPRLRRLVLAVVLPVRGDRRGLLPHRSVPARHRRGRGIDGGGGHAGDRTDPADDLPRVPLGGGVRERPRRESLRTPDRSADVPDVHPRRRGDRRRVLLRP